MARLDQVLKMAVQSKASDLHVPPAESFLIRQFGVLRKVKSAPLSADTVKNLIYEILTATQQKILEQNLQLDFSYEIKGVARFRGNVVLQRKGINATFRIIPFKVPTIDELGLPPVVKKFCDFHQGLVLVTGSTGQGKSTTLAAMIDHINSKRPDHILTIEDPIEFVHPMKKGVVNQRQLGIHTRSFSNALRSAMREDPDVIMIGELRDPESIRLAIAASEMGHLVMGTLATLSGPKTVDRLIDSCPPEEQNQIRTGLAEGLRAVITQKLLPKSDGQGQVLATEIMIATVPLGNLIRSEKTYQIPSIMQTGKGIGMQSMDDSILMHYKDGSITGETAYDYAENKKAFARMLKR